MIEKPHTTWALPLLMKENHQSAFSILAMSP
jgi:hypothetical protein